MPTQMIYSTTLRQINYIASWMNEYVDNIDNNNQFEVKLAAAMKEFVGELERLNVLEGGFLRNEKKRKLSLFGVNLENVKDYFGDVYCTTYKATFAELAQAHRHRTLDYKIEMTDKKEYFVPPIISFSSYLLLYHNITKNNIF